MSVWDFKVCCQRSSISLLIRKTLDEAPNFFQHSYCCASITNCFVSIWAETSGPLNQTQSKALDDTGSLYQSKASQKSPFLAAGSATQSTIGNTSNLKGKLSSLEVRRIVITIKKQKRLSYGYFCLFGPQIRFKIQSWSVTLWKLHNLTVSLSRWHLRELLKITEECSDLSRKRN